MSDKMDIEHILTDEIVCPYCGCIERDSCDIDTGKVDSCDMECDERFETFHVLKVETIRYTTFTK